jgi:hypothetical protein
MTRATRARRTNIKAVMVQREFFTNTEAGGKVTGKFRPRGVFLDHVDESCDG